MGANRWKRFGMPAQAADSSCQPGISVRATRRMEYQGRASRDQRVSTAVDRHRTTTLWSRGSARHRGSRTGKYPLTVLAMRPAPAMTGVRARRIFRESPCFFSRSVPGSLCASSPPVDPGEQDRADSRQVADCLFLCPGCAARISTCLFSSPAPRRTGNARSGCPG